MMSLSFGNITREIRHALERRACIIWPPIHAMDTAGGDGRSNQSACIFARMSGPTCKFVRSTCHPPPSNTISPTFCFLFISNYSVFAMEPPSKRRKVRKGTHSCKECRRRKMRCSIFDDSSIDTCVGCYKRGSKCVSQEVSDEDERRGLVCIARKPGMCDLPTPDWTPRSTETSVRCDASFYTTLC